ncbi:hypothetical protein ACI2K4_07775 [Micromonospora sp. NPDC050397]|uniref:hypothetical protein n=1 Tax=Micromonospora sp. NPDC050397 TaxID=3364279 RepID=UPI00384AF36F
MTVAVAYETERLVVRDWTEEPADLARVFEIYSLEEVSRWLGASSGLPLTDPARATAVVRRWHERLIRQRS